MGTKFGNVHVMTTRADDVIVALQEMSLEETYFIGTFESGWTSILKVGLDWGTTEEFGELLSEHVNYPILTVCFFDDDVLEVSLFRNGEYLTGHRWLSQYCDYELEEKKADISLFSEIFGHENYSQIQKILSQEDLETAVESIEEVIKIPLWVDAESFIDADPKEYQQFYTKYNFIV